MTTAMTAVMEEPCPNPTPKPTDAKPATCKVTVEDVAAASDDDLVLVDDWSDSAQSLSLLLSGVPDQDCDGPLYARPLKQGHFDHFCGVYAILNALRVANIKTGILADIDWGDIFVAIVTTIDQIGSVKDALLGGLTNPQFEACLQAATTYLKSRHKINVAYHWPWLNRRSLNRRSLNRIRLVKDLRTIMDDRSSVAVLRYRNSDIDHWSAVEAATAETLFFADSTRAYRIDVNRFSFGKLTANKGNGYFYLKPKSLLVITMTRKD
jgi:hypothetical protein